MKNVSKVEKVKPSTKVDIFINRPFVADQDSKKQKNESSDFQNMLDKEMDALREDKSFQKTVIDTLDEKEKVVASRDSKITKLKTAKEQFELFQSRGYMNDDIIRKNK